MQIIRIAFFIYFSLMSGMAFSRMQSPENELKSKLNSFKTMQSRFRQIVTNGKGKVLQRTSGKMYIQRPNKFRWDTQTPRKQLIVGDGSKIWNYDAGLRQATVKSFPKQRGNLPALVLSGFNKSITRSYRIHRSKDSIILDSKRRGAIFRRMQLWFSNGKLFRLNLLDKLGNTTRINFRSVQLNKSLSSSLFRFSPPRGVDVLKQ